MIETLDVLSLLHHHGGRPRPSVVVDMRAGVGPDQAPEVLTLLDLEARRVADRDDAPAQLDRADFAPVPAAPVVLDRRIRPVEVPIKKRKTLRALPHVLFHSPPDLADLGFVQQLVALQVEGPVARASLERQVGLLGEHDSTFLLGHVPDGSERLDLGVANPGDDVPGRVLAVADTDHQLIHERKQRADAFLDRVAVLDRVADDREARNLHWVAVASMTAMEGASAG